MSIESSIYQNFEYLEMRKKKLEGIELEKEKVAIFENPF